MTAQVERIYARYADVLSRPAPVSTAVDSPTEPAPAWRTLADIPDDPPRPLHLGILEPDGPTLQGQLSEVGVVGHHLPHRLVQPSSKSSFSQRGLM